MWCVITARFFVSQRLKLLDRFAYLSYSLSEPDITRFAKIDYGAEFCISFADT